MIKNPKISVIITCYNYGKFIDEAIESVKNQTFKDWELIIVDDCSTDKFTKTKIRELSSKYNTHNIIQLEKNIGTSAARNLGIKKAKAPYIICLDADDILDKEALNLMYKEIISGRYDVIGSGYSSFGTASDVVIHKYDKFKFCTVCQITNSSLFRKEDWQAINGFDESLIGSEDHDFWLKLINNGAKIHIIQDVLLYYRKHKEVSRYDSLVKENKLEEMSELIIKNNSKLFKWFLDEQRKKLRKRAKLNVKLKISLGVSAIVNIVQLLL